MQLLGVYALQLGSVCQHTLQQYAVNSVVMLLFSFAAVVFLLVSHVTSYDRYASEQWVFVLWLFCLWLQHQKQMYSCSSRGCGYGNSMPCKND
jgi:hypothetical protein